MQATAVQPIAVAALFPKCEHKMLADDGNGAAYLRTV